MWIWFREFVCVCVCVNTSNKRPLTNIDCTQRERARVSEGTREISERMRGREGGREGGQEGASEEERERVRT
jgi:hypothetical protein